MLFSTEPRTGESFFLELPNLNTQCFQIYLDEFSKAYADSFDVMLLDRGKFHHLKIAGNGGRDGDPKALETREV